MATPALAVTPVSFSFAGPAGTTNVASVSRTSNGVSITANALNFTVAPGSLTTLSQLTAGTRQIQQTAPGIGVNGGASAPQVDTNTPAQREAILFTASKAFQITRLKLSYIDSDDTLAIYGVNADHSLSYLGFGGQIINGLGGSAAFSHVGTNDGTTTLTLGTPTAAFDRYLFTTRVGGDVTYLGTKGQGYRIDLIAGSAVPEPESWALLVLGFGVVGLSVRRRRRVATVLG
ncbi:PEPxxWA-CTERM sorting domain-containing protein [Polymorphobacter sp.]|uniref:PEPxxWA-CTERM sorting domain-containing protein n=1 Tax=Polymorphobacter sp. TaxID=1909290 RepID=UPI003F724DF2